MFNNREAALIIFIKFDISAVAVAGGLNGLGDVLEYDPAAVAWTNLSAAMAASSGPAPPPRYAHGFATAMIPGGGEALYVHGGSGWDGGPGEPTTHHKL